MKTTDVLELAHRIGVEMEKPRCLYATGKVEILLNPMTGELMVRGVFDQAVQVFNGRVESGRVDAAQYCFELDKRLTTSSKCNIWEIADPKA